MQKFTLTLSLILGLNALAPLQAARAGESAKDSANMAGMAMAAKPHQAAWQPGQLRHDGLRIIPSGRNDGSHVLNPSQFKNPKVRHAYWIATQIPQVLNKLYCWCGCENRGQHRSNLACFEDLMGTDCDVCQGTAEIAYAMVKKGITNPAKIQAAVDARWMPKALHG